MSAEDSPEKDLIFELPITAKAMEEFSCLGFFPWPHDGKDLWFRPAKRGVLFVDEFHVPKRLRSLLKKHTWNVSMNKSFDTVVDCCVKTHERAGGTWITPDLASAYKELFREGKAFSVEVTETTTGRIVGGLFGTLLHGRVSAESMFHLESNASKVGLVYFFGQLKTQGVKFVDTQMVTPVTGMFGAREISNEEFLSL